MRELTKLEKFYIEKSPELSDAELASDMAGIGPKSIASYRKTLPSAIPKDTTEAKIEETEFERIKRLAGGPQAGTLLARQPGVVAMTQAASEVSDAKNIVRGTKMTKAEYEKINNKRIHTINPRTGQ
jgi:hypothetical protein